VTECASDVAESMAGAAAALASVAQGYLPFAEQGLVPPSIGTQVELVLPTGCQPEVLSVAQQ
jgi:hypothetical protein